MLIVYVMGAGLPGQLLLASAVERAPRGHAAALRRNACDGSSRLYKRCAAALSEVPVP